jgi:hypothetical protein
MRQESLRSLAEVVKPQRHQSAGSRRREGEKASRGQQAPLPVPASALAEQGGLLLDYICQAAQDESAQKYITANDRESPPASLALQQPEKPTFS